MKAAQFHRHGGPEVLVYDDVPDKIAGPGEVVVRVRACGVNGRDLWTRQGSPNHVVELPHILGCEIAGEIHALGPDVTGFKKGDRVAVHPGISCGSLLGVHLRAGQSLSGLHDRRLELRARRLRGARQDARGEYHSAARFAGV